ncbi:hypothetical protein QE152_g24783 [Popillia japonica]|uniref:Metallothionein n=1 Tax=Popillia japonica TaxID=7064 RepID=A0AAW1K623_POPJA
METPITTQPTPSSPVEEEDPNEEEENGKKVENIAAEIVGDVVLGTAIIHLQSDSVEASNDDSCCTGCCDCDCDEDNGDAGCGDCGGSSDDDCCDCVIL